MNLLVSPISPDYWIGKSHCTIKNRVNLACCNLSQWNYVKYPRKRRTKSSHQTMDKERLTGQTFNTEM